MTMFRRRISALHCVASHLYRDPSRLPAQGKISTQRPVPLTSRFRVCRLENNLVMTFAVEYFWA